MPRKKKPNESAALKDARSRYLELQGYAAKWAREGAPLHIMADCIAALNSVASEIENLEKKPRP